MLEFSLKKLRFLNYFLAALILIAVLLLIRDTVSFSLLKKEPPAAVSKNKLSRQTAMEKKNLMHYSSILEKNPFGSPMSLRPIAVSQAEGKETPDVSLSDLILVGTAVGSNNLSYAIFENKIQAQGPQEIFKLGENVFNYGRLKKIEKSSVEIERNASTYTVSIPDVINTTGNIAERTAETQQSSFAKQIGEREYIIDSRKIQKSLENPEQILTHARLLPNIKDGRQEGFTVSEVVPGGIYQSLGLRNGDILLKINGLEISNPEVAIQAMSALKGMNNVDLDIIRNGKNISMSYRIR
ncbi:MAG: PDZ domain-containing protein [Nitrospirae bacterium]|nr:PDZ domain-containing protein [Nitrospirota bacterium]